METVLLLAEDNERKMGKGVLGGSEKEGKTRVWEVRVRTLNVGTMTDIGSRLDAVMERSRVDIFFGQETWWKASKAKTIGGGFYHGVEEKWSNLEGKD